MLRYALDHVPYICGFSLILFTIQKLAKKACNVWRQGVVDVEGEHFTLEDSHDFLDTLFEFFEDLLPDGQTIKVELAPARTIFCCDSLEAKTNLFPFLFSNNDQRRNTECKCLAKLL